LGEGSLINAGPSPILQVPEYAGFLASGSSTWAITINGAISATDDVSPDPSGAGIALLNIGAALSARSTITIGSEGSVFGNVSGIVSAVAATITNNGEIGGGLTGIAFADNLSASTGEEDDGSDDFGSNLQISPSGAVRVVNAANAVIGGEFGGITNGTYSTLVASYAGTIVGGDRTYDFVAGEGFNFYNNSERNAAVYSGGIVTLTNAATGTITGSVVSNWLGSTITNAGTIFGMVDVNIDTTWIETGLGSPRVNVNRDFSISDDDGSLENILNNSTDHVITDPRLIGMTLTNTGIIDGYDEAIFWGPPEGEGEGNPYEKVAFFGSAVREIINNAATGVIYGSVRTTGGSDSISNSGYMEYIDTGDGNDVITIAATGRVVTEFEDAIWMGAGNDSLSANGTIVGDVLMLDGDDTMTSAGSIEGDIYLGAGNDSISSGSLLTGAVHADRLNIDAETRLYMSTNDDGNDTVNFLARSVIDSYVFLGSGNNTLTNAGTILAEDQVEFLVNQEVGPALVVTGALVGLEGRDNVTNAATGVIYGIVDLGDGGVTAASQTGASAGTTVIASNQTLTNAGRIFGVVEGEPDVLTSTALVRFGAGVDRLVNSGTIGSEGPIFFGNRFTTINLMTEFLNTDINPGVVVSMGAGNDAATNTGFIRGLISMGEGSDTVTGGANGDYVVDEAGADRYVLGAGADYVGITGKDGAGDTIDGGAGLDLLAVDLTDPLLQGQLGVAIDARAASGRIYYDVSDFTFANPTTVPLSAENAQVISFSAEDYDVDGGVDTIAGFEQYIGTEYDDIILGGAMAETIYGSLGNDTISGGGGKDLLIGDEGSDVFMFFAATDTGRVRATRDVISDFEEGLDKIALVLDSNTRAGTNAAGTQSAFEFVGMNEVFTGGGAAATQPTETPAEVRAYWAGLSTIVEVDTNGDGRSEFAIELTGRLELLESDFVFGHAAFGDYQYVPPPPPIEVIT
jgi:serralysin